MGNKKKVLVVDDESVVQDLARATLLRNGHEVLEAGDGLEACELLERMAGQVEVVVTDVKMPRMDGFELARKIGAAYPDIRVLYISGFASKPEVGGRFLAKPFRPSALLQAVESL